MRKYFNVSIEEKAQNNVRRTKLFEKVDFGEGDRAFDDYYADLEGRAGDRFRIRVVFDESIRDPVSFSLTYRV